MGTLLDTSVLIRAERAGLQLSVPDGEEVGIVSITASELLHGVHRADPRNRARRDAFVEHVLRTIPVKPFDLHAARVHAQLWADLASSGKLIGPHDLIVAATALALGWSVATYNQDEFSRVPGISISGPEFGETS
ncbi:MAG: type II toxin-antitoxin system VapC family toxin [Chloroflexi bacterium]|nr:type II toxin-antitoxin system VapC family toxin [Chloroflexota bacterium]